MENQNWKKQVLHILGSRMAKTTIAVLVGVVLLRLGINWWLTHGVGIPATVVRVEPILVKTLDKTLTLPGNVEAIEQATIYAHVSGYLKTIKVDEGDKVVKGQLLAQIDAPDVVQEYNNAKAEYDFKNVTRTRYDELLKEKVVSQQEYDKVNADANQAKARFDNANSNLEYTAVRAPFAGSVARRYKYPGDFISAPTKGGPPAPLFLLVNEEKLRIAVNVPQKEVGNVSIGHSVDIVVDTFPNEKFSGLVSRIDAMLDASTKTQRVLIDIDNPNIRLRAGMFASVVMHIERKDNVPMVAKEAVHTEGDKAFIFLVKDGKAEKTPVVLGDTQDDLVEISSPAVSREAQIVVGGGQALADGDPVKIAEKQLKEK